MRNESECKIQTEGPRGQIRRLCVSSIAKRQDPSEELSTVVRPGNMKAVIQGCHRISMCSQEMFWSALT